MTSDASKKLTPEEIQDSFKASLEGMIEIAEALSPLCGGSVSDLVELSKLALDSEAQCKFLLNVVARGSGKK